MVFANTDTIICHTHLFGNIEDNRAAIDVTVIPNAKKNSDGLLIHIQKVSHRGMLFLQVEMDLILGNKSLLGLASRAVGLQVARKELVPALGLPKTLWEEVTRWAGAIETPEKTAEPEESLAAPQEALGLGGPE